MLDRTLRAPRAYALTVQGVEPVLATLDPRVLERARKRLALELLVLVGVLLGLGLLSGTLLLEVPERGFLSAVPAALVIGSAWWPLSALRRALRDVPDLLARHYLLLVGMAEQASTPLRRRPWRDAIAAA